MPTEIRMPRLIDSMTQGPSSPGGSVRAIPCRPARSSPRSRPTRRRWTWNPPRPARLARIVVPAGSEKVEVGAVLAILDEVSTSGATIVEEPAPAPAVTSDPPQRTSARAGRR